MFNDPTTNPGASISGSYIKPSEVTTPAKRWRLIKVLYDPEAEKACPIALGEWDGRVVLAIRWNGHEGYPMGNPQSRGLPTWFILPARLNEAVLSTLSPESQQLVRSRLPDQTTP